MRAAESLIYADVNFNGKKVRVFTTHLQSVLFKRKEFQSIEILKNTEEGDKVDASKSLVRKLRTGYRFRADQAEAVRVHADASPYPEVVCGDFNDVPNSYTYFKIRGNRKDAFVEKGWGLGRTFQNISPTLRIDYILTDPALEVVGFKRFLVPYSDHFPQVVDLKIM
jgi:endonuclease/exonuclease/phosphatase family metal-dependent hydrolase